MHFELESSLEAFQRGEIDKSIFHYMTEIGEKAKIINQALNKRGLIGENSPIAFSKSKGGFYLWGKFKDGRNTDELSQEALQYGIYFVPGSIYEIDDEYNDSFRLAYPQIDKNKIDDVIQRFDNLVKK